MLRILFGAVTLALFATGALACDGQTAKMIFEDKFTDDSGGWAFGEDYGLFLKTPGATLKAPAAEGDLAVTKLNQTFNAAQGDFCVEMSFPPDAAQVDAGIGVVFLATDDANYWLVDVHSDGRVRLLKLINDQYSTVWDTTTANNLVKTSPTEMNAVRATIKNRTIRVIVNGQTVKSVRAKIPGGDLKFGFYGEYIKPSATPVLFTIRSYKVTAVE